MKTKLAMALVPLLVVGCGDELVDANNDGIADGVNQPGSVTVVAPATPVGTVGGQVLSTRYLPMDGVEVTMTIGGAMLGSKVVTDATGSFSFKDVPAGSRVLLTFSKAGYVTARATAVIPSRAGNVPINNANANFGPVMLAETNGTVKFVVYTPSGRPAVGAKATLHVNQAAYLLSSSAESLEGQVVVQGEVDGQGILSFSGVPNPEEGARIGSSYQLFVSPLDTNGDGLPDVDGYVSSYSGRDLLMGTGASDTYTTMTIQLDSAYPTTALGLRYASLGAISSGSVKPQHNFVRPGEPIYLVFNQPVQTNSLVVGLTDEYGKESLSINTSLSNGNTMLTLTPSQSITPGHEYNLTIHAAPVNGGADFDTVVPFFGGDLGNPQSIGIANVRFQDETPIAGSTAYTNGRLDAGERVYVNFNQVMTRLAPLGASNTAQVFFNVDIDGDGQLRSVGEINNPSNDGFDLVMDEPTRPIQTRTPAEEPVFGFGASGYTTRARFIYSGSRSLDTSAVSGAAPMLIMFSKLVPSSVTYESGWGVPQTTDLSVASMSAIAPPTPATP